MSEIQEKIMNGALAGKRILIVEDEPIIGMYTEDTLMEAGAVVVGLAANLAAAFNALEKTSDLDAVALDLNLAGESSGPLADALVERNVPFVMLTGYGETGIPAAHQSRPFLGKPFNPSTLVEAFVNVLKPAPV
jgi:DNA-binding NtrC family response regulator